MVFWIHCNKCLMQPTKSTAVELQITNCGHLFCVKCMEPGKLNKCLVCHAECSTVPVSNSMNPDIAFYFKDTSDMLQKYFQVSEFQNTHATGLFTHISKELQIVQNKYAQAKEHIKKITKNQSAVEKENQAIKEHVKKLNHDMVKLQNDNQRLRNFIKMSAGSPSPGVPPSCRGPLSTGGIWIEHKYTKPVSGFGQPTTKVGYGQETVSSRYTATSVDF
ncbi:nenya [Carabus blaptoides fortunei]